MAMCCTSVVVSKLIIKHCNKITTDSTRIPIMHSKQKKKVVLKGYGNGGNQVLRQTPLILGIQLGPKPESTTLISDLLEGMALSSGIPLSLFSTPHSFLDVHFDLADHKSYFLADFTNISSLNFFLL